MKINFISASDKALERREGRGFFEIQIDGKCVLSVCDDDIDDIYQLPKIIERILNANKNFEIVILTSEKVDFR